MSKRAFTLVELPAVSKWKRKAFTLVELLVVIGIIALLISILLPSLNKAREAANAVKCLSNARQFGYAFQLYVNAHKGTLPIHYRDSSGNHTLAVESSMWCVQFSKILSLNWADQVVLNGNDEYGGPGPNPARIWICPSDSKEFPIGYAVNYPTVITNQGSSSSIARPPLEITKLRHAASLMVMAESNGSPGLVLSPLVNFVPIGAAWGWPYGADTDTDADGQVDSNSILLDPRYDVRTGNIGFRHNKRASIVFADGHADQKHVKELVDNVDDIWGTKLPQK